MMEIIDLQYFIWSHMRMIRLLLIKTTTSMEMKDTISGLSIGNRMWQENIE